MASVGNIVPILSFTVEKLPAQPDDTQVIGDFEAVEADETVDSVVKLITAPSLEQGDHTS